MLMPGKHLREEHSLLYLGGVVLSAVNGVRSLSVLWDLVRPQVPQFSFDNFVLALDFLFSIGVVELNDYDVLQRRGAS